MRIAFHVIQVNSGQMFENSKATGSNGKNHNSMTLSAFYLNRKGKRGKERESWYMIATQPTAQTESKRFFLRFFYKGFSAWSEREGQRGMRASE